MGSKPRLRRQVFHIFGGKVCGKVREKAGKTRDKMGKSYLCTKEDYLSPKL